MTGVEFSIGSLSLVAAIMFVIGLHLMRAPSTARRGNGVSAIGMGVAVVSAAVFSLVDADNPWGWIALTLGLIAGGLFGVFRARRVPMTEIPQLVSVFNAVGGGAAATVALADYVLHLRASTLPPVTSIPLVLDVLIGSVTLSGSLIAAGKLQGIIPGKPIRFPGARAINVIVVFTALAAGALVTLSTHNLVLMLVVLIAALAFGVLMVLPIGGADAPVIVSLLNALTGLAVAMAGFAIDNQALIIAGALVGAAGTILTLQMAKAMNRPVVSIILGGFGTGDSVSTSRGIADDLTDIRQVSVDDVAIQLAYARHVLIVPGYGLAAAQAQHEVAELATLLTAHGVDVKYAIHPVAGRMPGHMNVLLAEANVPYTQMLQLDEANAAFDTCDIALVVGANDVCNPVARRPGNAVSGMPILDVDRAASVVVLKRSMSTGYAGIPNPLFTDAKTGMFFADAKKGLADIIVATKEYVAA
ncbi:NAD(P)(+) transhydrogenase (Re/Si-specific) subunit beta [Glaciihabitans sp. UYNi722]|uniref:NAD(P)(+) transhydrogenase (Re/Si-specific) subunit beta n=1 Tax=Glaciihabitans sp. UYNi722 TaxID=3156344 RepID=UPI003397B9A8